MARKSKKRRRLRKTARIVPVRRSVPGAAPGTIVADPAAPAPVIRVMTYGPSELAETMGDALPATLAPPADGIVWIDVDGLGDGDVIQTLGQAFGLHPLALEDVAGTHQRPKIDDYDDHLFCVLRMPPQEIGEEPEQVAIFVGDRFVLTFQEGRPGDCFEPVRERLRKCRGRIRTSGADYLAYTLIDAIVDHYFPLLEQLGDHIEQLYAVVHSGATDPLEQIDQVRRDLLVLRRALWPMREVIDALRRPDAFDLIADETGVHFRDCYDHAIQLTDILDTCKDSCAALLDAHHSVMAHRTNDVMRLLTIIATIFIPLTFIAGVYGMNFQPSASRWNMPELAWAYGYPFALLLMASTAALLVVYFVRRGWLGGSSPAHTELDRHADAPRSAPD